jgi:hypothetical protein
MHIPEARFIGNHAAMGPSTPAGTEAPFFTELRAGARRRALRREQESGTSAGDSESGATEGDLE